MSQHILFVTGSDEDVNKFYIDNHIISNNNYRFTLANLIPVSTDNDKQFCIDKWGVPQDIGSSFSNLSENNTKLTIVFVSNDTYNIGNWLREATKMYPTLSFAYKFYNIILGWGYEFCSKRGKVIRTRMMMSEGFRKIMQDVDNKPAGNSCIMSS